MEIMEGSSNFLAIDFDVYGYLAGPLWEKYEKNLLFKRETFPVFIEKKIKEYIPQDPRKNIELKKILYLAFFEGEIRRREEIAKVIGYELAATLASRAMFYYGLLKDEAREEKITLARTIMRFQIPDNRSNVVSFLDPEKKATVSIIDPENDSFFMTVVVVIDNWRAPKTFSNLLANG